MNQSSAANKTLLPNKSAFKKKVEEEKKEKEQDDDDMEVAVVSENPTDMINDWQNHRNMESANFSSS